VLPQPLAALLGYAGVSLPGDAIVPLRRQRNEPYAFVLRTEAFEAVVAADPLNRVAVAGPTAISR
jgi:hypothetical protein